MIQLDHFMGAHVVTIQLVLCLMDLAEQNPFCIIGPGTREEASGNFIQLERGSFTSEGTPEKGPFKPRLARSAHKPRITVAWGTDRVCDTGVLFPQLIDRMPGFRFNHHEGEIQAFRAFGGTDRRQLSITRQTGTLYNTLTVVK